MWIGQADYAAPHAVGSRLWLCAPHLGHDSKMDELAREYVVYRVGGYLVKVVYFSWFTAFPVIVTEQYGRGEPIGTCAQRVYKLTRDRKRMYIKDQHIDPNDEMASVEAVKDDWWYSGAWLVPDAHFPQ